MKDSLTPQSLAFLTSCALAARIRSVPAVSPDRSAISAAMFAISFCRRISSRFSMTVAPASCAMSGTAAADGRTALPAFTGLDALTAWKADARPVPCRLDELAASAVEQGSVPAYLPTTALSAFSIEPGAHLIRMKLLSPIIERSVKFTAMRNRAWSAKTSPLETTSS